MFIEYQCAECGISVRKQENKKLPGKFCSRQCKSNFQRRAKPVSKEWLIEHYIDKQMDCKQIGKLVNRDAKSVWNWLKDFNIPTRKRGTTGNGWNPLKGTANPMLGRKHSSETKARLSAIAKADGRVPFNPSIGSYMKGRKGADTPNWKGGVTPERQSVYSSLEWVNISKQIWKRAKAKCERCGKKHNTKESRGTFHIHHIVSFAVAELRTELTNLVLLCKDCHHFVHSKANINKQFIKEMK